MARGTKRNGATVAVADEATLLAEEYANRESVTFQNLGTADVWLWNAGVTVGVGIRLTPGMLVNDSSSRDAWYGITDTGTVDVFVGEIEE